MIVCGKEHAGHFMSFLGSGKEYGVKLSYALQHGAGGIAEALGLAQDFVDEDKVAVILGDNIFEDDFSEDFKAFQNERGSKVFLKEVSDPQRFGVAEINDNKIVSTEEKPKKPKSNLAIVGLYLYDPDVFTKIKKLVPSARGELEITDLHNIYIGEGSLSYGTVKGFWSDAGTFDSLLKTTIWASKHV
jgi:glucose-1-phosphate thymidylyltransferase